jgi:hypothetical protein
MLVINLRVLLNVNDRQFLSLLCQTVSYRAPIPLLYDRHFTCLFCRTSAIQEWIAKISKYNLYAMQCISCCK